MATRGRKYREDREFDYMGGEMTLQLRPLVDGEFLPRAGRLAAHFGVEDQDIGSKEVLDKSKEEIEEAREEDGSIDVSKLDDTFVEIMQEAAILGITSDYDEDGNKVPMNDEQAADFISDLLGGLSIEIGGEVMDLSGNIRDAEKFRGGRGSV